MPSGLKHAEDFLEIILNYLVILCLLTAADAVFGKLQMPIWQLCLPVCLPLFFYMLRKRSGNLFLFLMLHPAAVALLFGAADYTPLPLLWKIVFVLIGAGYSLQSVKIRIMGDEDAEGEIPTALAGCLAVAAFFLCSYVREEAGGERIVWICFAWLLLCLLKKYLGNFITYVNMNRRMSGAMPEKSIFRVGMITVSGFGCFSVLLLMLCAQTPLVGWLSRLVRKVGRFLASLIYRFVMLFAGGESENAAIGEAGDMQMPGAIQGVESPPWLRILDTIVTMAVTFALIAGALVMLALFIRFLIQKFYAGQKDVKEVTGEGFVEEEERLDSGKRGRGKRLPLFGGTMQQQVRRIFKRTVQEAFAGENNLAGMTAQEIAGMETGQSAKEWAILSAIYERARYARDAVTKEDVKTAGKLSGEILHNIK